MLSSFKANFLMCPVTKRLVFRTTTTAKSSVLFNLANIAILIGKFINPINHHRSIRPYSDTNTTCRINILFFSIRKIIRKGSRRAGIDQFDHFFFGGSINIYPGFLLKVKHTRKVFCANLRMKTGIGIPANGDFIVAV